MDLNKDNVTDIYFTGINDSIQYGNSFERDISDINSITKWQSKHYEIGEDIQFTLELTDEVTVDTYLSTPVLVLKTGVNDKEVNADYVSGSGSDKLVFKYTVKSEDTEIALDGLRAKSLRLNNTNITPVAFVKPKIESIRADVANGTYGRYSEIPIEIKFNDKELVKLSNSNSHNYPT